MLTMYDDWEHVVETVRNHMSNIRRKLGARDRTQAVIRAIRSGLVRLEN